MITKTYIEKYKRTVEYFLQKLTISLGGQNKRTDDYPVFVMGAERSGTSTMAVFLKTKLGYVGYSEGHIFSLLEEILVKIAQHYNSKGLTPLIKSKEGNSTKYDSTAAQAISYLVVDSEIKTLWKKLVGSIHSGLWFDKTPGPELIKCAPYLADMYKTARFVYMIRDPVAAVESNRRKFGSSFESACDRWRDCAQAWIKVKALMPKNSFLEIKTHELSENYEQVQRSIVSLLSDHSLKLNELDLSANQIGIYERTSSGCLSREASTDSVDWSSEQHEYFNIHCRPLGRIYGFFRNAQSSSETVIVLAPPVGQVNVETVCGKGATIAPQLYENEMCIFMHPSEGGVETKITWQKIEVPGPVRISFNAFLHPEAQVSVTFVIKAMPFKEGEETLEVVCNPGNKKEVVLQGSFIGPNNQLSVSVRSQSDSIQCAWAYISCPVISYHNLKPSNAP